MLLSFLASGGTKQRDELAGRDVEADVAHGSNVAEEVLRQADQAQVGHTIRATHAAIRKAHVDRHAEHNPSRDQAGGDRGNRGIARILDGREDAYGQGLRRRPGHHRAACSPGPARNKVMTSSSKETMNPNSAPASKPGRMIGMVMRKKVRSLPAPRLRAASSIEPSTAARLAITRRMTKGMMSTACAATSPGKVWSARPARVNATSNARPRTTPGKSIGDNSSAEIAALARNR